MPNIQAILLPKKSSDAPAKVGCAAASDVSKMMGWEASLPETPPVTNIGSASMIHDRRVRKAAVAQVRQAAGATEIGL